MFSFTLLNKALQNNLLLPADYLYHHFSTTIFLAWFSILSAWFKSIFTSFSKLLEWNIHFHFVLNYRQLNKLEKFNYAWSYQCKKTKKPTNIHKPPEVRLLPVRTIFRFISFFISFRWGCYSHIAVQKSDISRQGEMQILKNKALVKCNKLCWAECICKLY